MKLVKKGFLEFHKPPMNYTITLRRTRDRFNIDLKIGSTDMLGISKYGNQLLVKDLFENRDTAHIFMFITEQDKKNFVRYQSPIRNKIMVYVYSLKDSKELYITVIESQYIQNEEASDVWWMITQNRNILLNSVDFFSMSRWDSASEETVKLWRKPYKDQELKEAKEK